MGHKEAILIPVCEGVPVLRLWQAMPLAGEAVEKQIKNGINIGQLSPEESIDNIVEDIKGIILVTTYNSIYSLDIQCYNNYSVNNF